MYTSYFRSRCLNNYIHIKTFISNPSALFKCYKEPTMLSAIFNVDTIGNTSKVTDGIIDKPQLSRWKLHVAGINLRR